MKKHLIKKAMELVRGGCGRTAIADNLKIHQWEARQLQIAAEALIALEVTPNSLKRVIKPVETNSDFHVVLSDLHIPYHNPKCVKLALDFCKREQPNVVHLLGDVIDFYNISRFNKNPERKFTLQDELDEATEFIYNLTQVVPNARIIYYEGNHEERLKKYLWSQTPELSSLRALNLEELLQLRDFNIEFLNYNEIHKHQHLTFSHGNIISKWSGHTAKRMIDTVGCSTIHGHSHRLGSSFQTTFGSDLVAYENGCLCELNPEYVKGKPNWQLGFSTVYFVENQFFVIQVPIINYSYIYNGKLYKA